MCKGSQVSKATLCVQNLKWRTVSDDGQGPKKTFDRLPIEPFLNIFSQLRPKPSNAPENAKHLSGFKRGNKFEGFTAKPKSVPLCSRKQNADSYNRCWFCGYETLPEDPDPRNHLQPAGFDTCNTQISTTRVFVAFDRWTLVHVANIINLKGRERLCKGLEAIRSLRPSVYIRA